MFEDVSLLSDTKQLNGVSQFQQLSMTEKPETVNGLKVGDTPDQLRQKNLCGCLRFCYVPENEQLGWTDYCLRSAGMQVRVHPVT